MNHWGHMETKQCKTTRQGTHPPEAHRKLVGAQHGLLLVVGRQELGEQPIRPPLPLLICEALQIPAARVREVTAALLRVASHCISCPGRECQTLIHTNNSAGGTCVESKWSIAIYSA